MDWINKLSKQPIFFITPDIKRGMGLEDILPNFYIICSFTDPVISSLRKKNAKIYCLEESFSEKDLPRNSGHLLEKKEVQEYIRRSATSTPVISYFKPSLKLDWLIKEKKYKKAGNSYKLNEQFENKINLSFLNKIGLTNYLIKSMTGRLKDLSFKDISAKIYLPFIVQFGHGWAGKTTFEVKDEKSFLVIKNKFPLTIVKISKKVIGFSLLNNCCVYQKEILVSQPAVQISGIKKLSPKSFVTCGRQWPALLISGEIENEIFDISCKIGKYMASCSYKGFFGIDFLVEKSSGRLFVTEINARFTASSAFYTRLERGLGRTPLMAYHYASFLGIDLKSHYEKPSEVEGSQIIIREKKTADKIKLHKFGLNNSDSYEPEKLKENQFIYIKNERKESEELARIESKSPVLASPGKLAPWMERILSG